MRHRRVQKKISYCSISSSTTLQSGLLFGNHIIYCIKCAWQSIEGLKRSDNYSNPKKQQLQNVPLHEISLYYLYIEMCVFTVINSSGTFLLPSSVTSQQRRASLNKRCASSFTRRLSSVNFSI